jgi:hypothetical protein
MLVGGDAALVAATDELVVSADASEEVSFEHAAAVDIATGVRPAAATAFR